MAATGPCACPACGWDDHGHLRVLDWYAGQRPPIPPPRHSTLVIQGADDEVSVTHDIDVCEACGEPLSPATVAMREAARP